METSDLSAGFDAAGGWTEVGSFEVSLRR